MSDDLRFMGARLRIVSKFLLEISKLITLKGWGNPTPT